MSASGTLVNRTMAQRDCMGSITWDPHSKQAERMATVKTILRPMLAMPTAICWWREVQQTTQHMQTEMVKCIPLLAWLISR
jgi:hypothetical protein